MSDERKSVIEAYLEARYGPGWEHLRCGRGGECAYCSGKITTEKSRELRAMVIAAGGRIAEEGQCAVEARKAKRK